MNELTNYIQEIMLESTESHSLEADDDYTRGFNNALYAVLSKIESLQELNK